MSDNSNTHQRNSTSLLQELINHAQNSIIIAEKRGDDAIIIFVNKAFSEMTGYTKTEILNKDCRFLQGTDRNQKGALKLRHAMNQKEAVRSVIRNYKKNNEMFWNEVTITPFHDKESDIMYFIGEQRDITKLVEVGYKLADSTTITH